MERKKEMEDKTKPLRRTSMETNIAALSTDIWKESEGNKHRQKRRAGQREERRGAVSGRNWTQRISRNKKMDGHSRLRKHQGQAGVIWRTSQMTKNS